MADLRAEVLAAIRGGAHTNKAIQEAVLGAVAHCGYSREIDSAIQRLRKAGEIKLIDREWHTSDRKPCKHCGGTGWAPASPRRDGTDGA